MGVAGFTCDLHGKKGFKTSESHCGEKKECRQQRDFHHRSGCKSIEKTKETNKKTGELEKKVSCKSSQNRKLQRVEEKKLPNKPRRGASDCRLASVGSLLPTGSFCSYALSILSHALLLKVNLLSRTQVAITALNN